MDRGIHNNSAIIVLNGRKQIVGIVRQPPKCTAEFPGGSGEISLGNSGSRVIMDRYDFPGYIKITIIYISHNRPSI